MGTHPLPERAALPAFPRLEISGADECQGLVVLSGLVVKRTKLHAQVVALLDELEMFLQVAQTFRGVFTETFPKLIALKQQPSISGIGSERPIVYGPRLGGLVANVEIADAKIAPDDGELRIQFGAALPKLDRFLMTATVIEQVAQIIRRARIARIGAHGRL